MNAANTRKRAKATGWPRIVTLGRVKVTVYRREMPNGKPGFMIANYSQGKRRFDSYTGEQEALEAAGKLARQLSERDVLGASMTSQETVDYASAVQTLSPYNVSLPVAAGVLSECLKLVGDLSSLHAAVRDYAARHKRTVPKRVAEVVTELLAVKVARGISPRYKQDLDYRLSRFAEAFQKDVHNITVAEIQQWLDRQKLKPQGYKNYRQVLNLFFKHAIRNNYASENPVVETEKVKVRGGEIEIFTPAEMSRLLAAADPDFLPCLCLGGFAGLRSAEIERLEWSDINLAEKFIVVGASKAKTAGRRIIPIADNLAEWLRPYADKQDKVWRAGHDEFYEAQQATAAATGIEADEDKGIKAVEPVKWKANALRHAFASYKFSLTNDAGHVAGLLGNSAAVVHKHYRELVRPAEAERWFNLRPKAPANVISFRKEVVCR